MEWRYLAGIAFLFCVLCSNAQSYKTIHNKAIVVDTHNDVLSSATMHGLNIANNLTGKTHSDIERFKIGGIDVQVFSIFCDENFGKDTAFKFANIEIDSLYAIVNRNSSQMAIIASQEQLQEAVEKGKLACMIGVEGGHMIEDDIGNLERLYLRGARYLTLTWNNSTSWASSAKDEFNKEKGAQGLNDFGRQVVKKMNELGMMVDLSHVGEQTFADVMQVTTKPVLLSHSSVYTLCPVFRNVKDDQIKALAKNGGVMQVNFYSGFLDSKYHNARQAIFEKHRAERDSLKKLNLPEYTISEQLAKKYAVEMEEIRPPLSLVIDHIDYIVKMVGVDYVGLGADMDGIESMPKGINGVEDLPKVTRALLERGYSKSDVFKILGGNFIRVFEANSSK